MIHILIGVIVILLATSIALYVYRRFAANKVNDLQAAKQKVTELHLEKAIHNGEKMSLTGESLAQFQELQADYEDLSNQLLPQIDEQADVIRKELHGINFIRIKSELDALTERVTNVQLIANHIKESLKLLNDSDKKHRQAVSQLEKKYKELRKNLLSQNFTFGSSIDQLEERLSKLEGEFDEFSALTTSGDHVAAQEILGHLQTETTELEEMLQVIPELNSKLTKKYPAQLFELKSGYQRLLKDGYQFNEQPEIDNQLTDLEQQRKTTLTRLNELKIDLVAVDNKQIEEQIDHLYDVMETEMDARKRVNEQIAGFSQHIHHANRQNRELLLELDRISQNFVLEHGELETARGLGDQIKRIEEQAATISTAIEDNKVVYSQALADITAGEKELTQIEMTQTKINDDVAGLQETENHAKETLQKSITRIHAVKRRMENLNLPGLPQDYLDYFFVVSDEITKLDADLKHVKINLEDITKQLVIVTADLETLEEKSNDIRDSAILTEQLMQYANRYRNGNERVNKAMGKAQQLYEKDFNYPKSLETIGSVLDKVEPGSYKKIEDQYYGSLGK